MFKKMITLATLLAVLASATTPCAARGGGRDGRGGFGGGRGFGGGYRGGDFGRYRGGDFRRASNFNPTRDLNSSRSLPDFDRGAMNGINRDYRGDRRFNQHSNLPNELSFGRTGARDLMPAGHATHAWSRDTMHNRANDVRDNFWHRDVFNQNWWHDHPGAWFAAGWGWGAAWAGAAWPAIGGLYGWGSGVEPVSYDYGTNIVYDGSNVYYGDQPTTSAEDFYTQAQTIATSGGATDPNQGEWKPLGVFGLAQGDQDNLTAMVQLATNKDGTIAGNFADLLTGNTLPVKGSVDKQTQRAAWTVGDNTDTVYETGIYNLTQEQTPMLVHFGKDRTQQWLLVRLKRPDDAQQSGTADAIGDTAPLGDALQE